MNYRTLGDSGADSAGDALFSPLTNGSVIVWLVEEGDDVQLAATRFPLLHHMPPIGADRETWRVERPRSHGLSTSSDWGLQRLRAFPRRMLERLIHKSAI